MKNLILLMMLIPVLPAFADAKIHSVSNIAGAKVVVEVAAKDRSLLMLDLASGKKEALPFPATEEEVMGTILLSDRLLLISQWTAGGGKPANLHELELKSRKWAAPREIACVSFDRVVASKNELKVSCEAGPFTESKAKDVTVKFGGKPEAKVDLELPLAAYAREKFSYQLKGDLMAWDSMETKSPTGKKRVIKAEGLLAK